MNARHHRLEINVINLPQAKVRKEAFLAANSHKGLCYAFAEGVDSETLDFEQLKEQNLIEAKTTFRTPGCGLAHRNLWLKCAQTKRPMIICEDDVILRKDFRTQFLASVNAIPADWEILLLGYNFDGIIDVDIIPGVEHLGGHFVKKKLGPPELQSFQNARFQVIVWPLLNAFGTPAYAISPSGARYLLEHVFPLRNCPVTIPSQGRTVLAYTFDTIMNALYCKMKAYACVPPIAISPNERDPNARFVRTT